MHNVLNFVHTSNFYNKAQLEGLTSTARSLTYAPSEFGTFSQNFNYIQPEAEKTFSEVLNRPVTIDPNTGYFHRPDTGIHFDSYNNFGSWKFVIAIERSMFTQFHHKSGAKSALDGTQFNYSNMFEWEYQSNILMEPGQGLFYRPWTFHAFDSYAIIQSFDIIETPKAVSKTILVMGSKGSGKTTFAKQLATQLNASYLNEETFNQSYNVLNDSIESEVKQAERFNRLVVLADTKYTVVDFKCERQMSRDLLAPDFVIWFDTVDRPIVLEEPKRANVVMKSLNYDINEFVTKFNSLNL